LLDNSTGYNNVALGTSALLQNSGGYFNTSVGANAMNANQSGYMNSVYGESALYSSTSGVYNTALGYKAGYLHTNNRLTAIGNQAGDGYQHGSYCTFIGAFTDANAAGFTNSIALGDAATITASNQVRIGDAAVGSIGGYAPWTDLSDSRFKQNVREDVRGLDFIVKLRPVTYNMDVRGLNDFLGVPNDKTESIAQKESIRYSGFIAQEVEIAAQETGYDFGGVKKPESSTDFYGLSYSEFVVPLVKAVQEQQAQIQQQQSMIDQLVEKNRELEAKVEKLEKTVQ
jgi:hypothetical protein